MSAMIMGIEHLIYVIALILLIVFFAIWSFHILALIYGKYKFHRKSKRVVENAPGVTIMKPLMGVDDNLRDNLETFFTLDYPKYELLFCVQDPNDPAIMLVRNLIDQYPNADARLFYGGKPIGINPKINNLSQAYDQIKYDLLLISDSGLRMAKDTLDDMVSLMTDKVGLVHQMPFTSDRPGFGGSLEKVYFGTCHCRMYLFINLIGVNCVTGMSCLMRKCVLDKIGGLKAYSNYLAEDYFIAKTYIDDNWVIQLSHQPAAQNTANYSVPSWQKRMIRWCKLRLRLTPMAWLEPFQECFLLGIMSSWTVNYLFGWNSLVFFLIHVLCWFLSDYTLLKITQNGRLPFNKFEYMLCWLYRETICYYLFLKAINPTVKWRDGTYRLKWGGLSELVQEKTRTTLVRQSSVSHDEAAKLVAAVTVTAATAITVTATPATASASLLQVNENIPQPVPNSSQLRHSSSNTDVNLLPTSTASSSSTSSASSISNGSRTSSLNGGSGSSNAKNATGLNHHKRTSSYSVIMKSSNNHSDLFTATEATRTPLLTQQHSPSLSLTNNYASAYGSSTSNYRPSPYHNSFYHHQHHHSMSVPVSSNINKNI